jgi:UDP-glucose 4-epimerase
MSTLITGNRGFIGSGLKGDGIDIKDGVDIVDYKATKKYDVVIHTAAKISVTESMEKPEEYIRTNVVGTLSMLEQHPEAHFIYLSTAGIYGEGLKHTVDSPLRPTSVYATTKLVGEFLVRRYAKSWTILRLTNVIGDGERGEPNVYQVFKKSDIIPIYGDGMQTRDFIHVDKVREAIYGATRKTGIFNVGSGVSRTVLEVAKEFNKPIQFLPERPGEIRNFGLDLETDAKIYDEYKRLEGDLCCQ